MSTHVTDRLSAYLDGALAATDLEAVQAHLEVCGTCGRAYDELRALRGVLRHLPDPPMPAGLAERIHWRLGREEAKAGLPAWRSAWAAWRRLVPAGPFAARPVRLAFAGLVMLILAGLPLGGLSGLFAPRATVFDPDAYVRDYVVLSSDRLTDDVTRTIIVHTALPESTTQR